ncbi:hypothetical protein PSU4_30360 [Pseudonocardia sulfidoxydans NBRC 16205]|uniref:Uncharacterized protein n=1 Tax=Pseudonocardia sulfidoxydans NBRC 16205 TaxID=1223511 RepID=A0A511DH18_9PSEU|nr:hypothetical protein PSU4_30360 [Pseudonocardia sulfidoxydans NBRC 16205]
MRVHADGEQEQLVNAVVDRGRGDTDGDEPGELSDQAHPGTLLRRGHAVRLATRPGAAPSGARRAAWNGCRRLTPAPRPPVPGAPRGTAAAGSHGRNLAAAAGPKRSSEVARGCRHRARSAPLLHPTTTLRYKLGVASN